MKLRKRILCVILAAVFVFLCAPASVSAATKYDPNMMIRAGIIYGDNVSPSFAVSFDSGCVLGIFATSRKFVKLCEMPGIKKIVAVLQQNYSYNSKTGAYTPSEKSVAIGKYHIELTKDFLTYRNASEKAKRLSDKGFDSYVAYINGKYKVRSGAYASKSDASKVLASFPYIASVVTGSGQGVLLLNADNNKPVFECDSLTDNVKPGVSALPDKEGKTYLGTPGGSLFDGAFELSFVDDGVKVINLISLDKYVLGVLPWEIYPSWPADSIRSFAVAMRTFAVYHYGARHNSSDGFDVCTTSHCQCYKGMSRYFEEMKEAVDTTSGQILTYNGEPTMTVYCGTNGGITEDVRDIWGQNVLYPYLTSVTIPLEQESCYSQPKGVWSKEVTGKELSESFQASTNAERKALTAPITALNIKKYSKYSRVYVSELEIVDAKGHTATVKTSSSVRSAMPGFCLSAYFTVTYNYLVNVQSAKLAQSVKLANTNTVAVTANGEVSLENTSPQTLRVLTKDGTYSLDSEQYTITIDGKGNGHGGGLSMYGSVDLANAGYGYKDILTTYYPYTEITAVGSPTEPDLWEDTSIEKPLGEDDDLVPVSTDVKFEEVDQKVKTTASLNLRSGPGKEFPVIKTVSSGTELLRTGIGDNGWDRILLDDGTAVYASAEYLELIGEGDPDTPEDDPTHDEDGFLIVDQKVKMTAAVYLRKGPGVSYEKDITAKSGMILHRIGIGPDGWDKILKDDGVVIYAPTDYLELVEEITPVVPEDPTHDKDGYEIVDEQVVTTAQLNLRSGPGTEFDIVTTVAKGTELLRTGIGDNGWDKITLDGDTVVYASSQYLKLKE